MDKTVDLSLSQRTVQYFVAAGVTWFFALAAFGLLTTFTDVAIRTALVATVVAWLVVTVLWVRRLGGDDDATTWDAIPEWQYNGRFAEAGGLTRSEQEAALDELNDEE
ncbi:hypothetical protein [Haloarcula salinisoli]|uniref:Uncharacterized protein n=1 Tax=Haloarcula salinisoli TaxID=2487746 RepID=A0A8J7YB66_9EURY|nr:hypothetical protein [Halomicroarcula salinisoli]MBX0285793.1 hypothetical protein [Halomicroarcula salinisoli]MBX0302720.1 hypothetical protein [Halomicroarcula salinisoli]